MHLFKLSELEDVANWLASAKAMIVDLLEDVPGLERVYSVINQVSANYLSLCFTQKETHFRFQKWLISMALDVVQAKLEG